MKKLYISLSMLLFTTMAFGQIPDGSIVPNFQTPTLDGDTFDLYHELNQGRSVIMDVSATWCGPCWSFHNTHALRDLYNAHGPDGDNKVNVLFIEGDATTPIDCLYGNCTNTQGDWVTGTPYPITDNAYIAGDILKVNAYPTLFLVCPDRTIKEIDRNTGEGLFNETLACPVASGANNASVISISSGVEDVSFCGSLDLTPSSTIVNVGTEQLTSATVELTYGGEALQSVEWTGDLGTYMSAEISFAPVTVTETGDLMVTVSNINGGVADEDTSNDSKSIALSKAEVDEQVITALVKTDEYGNEIYWECRLADGTVVGQGGNEAVGPNGGGQYTTSSPPNGNGYYGNFTEYTHEIAIPSADCYYFHVVDGYGDGFCCSYGEGHFKVYDGTDTSVPPTFEINPVFTAYTRSDFGTSAEYVGANELVKSGSLNVYPNPAATSITLSFEMEEANNIGVVITNTLGQTVHQIAPTNMVTGQHTLMIPVNELANGIYNINLTSEEGSVSVPFTVFK